MTGCGKPNETLRYASSLECIQAGANKKSPINMVYPEAISLGYGTLQRGG